MNNDNKDKKFNKELFLKATKKVYDIIHKISIVLALISLIRIGSIVIPVFLDPKIKEEAEAFAKRIECLERELKLTGENYNGEQTDACLEFMWDYYYQKAGIWKYQDNISKIWLTKKYNKLKDNVHILEEFDGKYYGIEGEEISKAEYDKLRAYDTEKNVIWNNPNVSGGGDCEDLSIALHEKLNELGIKNELLGLSFPSSAGHMVNLVIDNNNLLVFDMAFEISVSDVIGADNREGIYYVRPLEEAIKYYLEYTGGGDNLVMIIPKIVDVCVNNNGEIVVMKEVPLGKYLEDYYRQQAQEDKYNRIKSLVKSRKFPFSETV